MISIENLTIEFNATPLFSNVGYVINKKDRIALVGKNGAGKSTMLKAIAGLQAPTKGNIAMPKDITVGYLPQVMKLSDDKTVKEETELAFSSLFQLKKQLEEINNEMAQRTDYESEGYQKLIESYTSKEERLRMMGGDNYHAQLERTLLGLGFSHDDLSRSTSEFSGGWRMRIELAKILLQSPDVLLLDEPTNHLDIESITWLENFLKSSASAVVLVSHDKAFVNAVTNRTIEISCAKIYDYKVKYDEFIKIRHERREQQIRAYENQQKQIADIESFIERFRYKPTKSVQVQSRIKQLEKIERIEIDEEDRSSLRLKFPPASRSGDYPIICEEVGKTYGQHNVFHNVNLTIERGSKVAFVGKNGEGKSTLVKCILGEIPFDGDLKIGHGVKIGYFAQNQAQLLDENLTVFDTIDYVAVGDIRTKIRDILGSFMFGGEASDKKVKVLSGGERTRLAMIKLLLEPANLLILDEPTNHLDIRSKDVLKEAIKDFEGTVIIVSHDRDFLDGLVSDIYEFGGGDVIHHIGGIYDYLAKKQLELSNIASLDNVFVTEKQSQPLQDKETEKNEGGALTYAQQKEIQKKVRKLEKAVKSAEQEIASIEDQIAKIEEEMATPEGATNSDLYTKHGAFKKQLDHAMEVWEKAVEDLDNV